MEQLARRKQALCPGSTYRLQFNANFRFDDASALVPYLKSLGITTCYASPLLQARSGSTHGYDIVDHNSLNSDIGTEREFLQFISTLHEHQMDLLLDVVPNHMGVGYGTNPWWQDVLQNGRTSKFADYFDIDWNPLKPELHSKVLIPILGSQYGEELENGKLVLGYSDGEFFIDYYDRHLPIDPQTIPLIFDGLTAQSSAPVRELLGILSELSTAPRNDATQPDRIAQRRNTIPTLTQRLRELVENSPELQRLIASNVTRLNGKPGDPRSFDALHELLEAQAYRLAHWRVSAEEINYRRFFDINDLVGLRMEDPAVFAATQKLIRRLLADGSVQGLRIDHPDGLFNPPQYFTRLQMLYAASHCCGPEPNEPVAENGIERDIQTAFGQHKWTQSNAPLYVVVEKILERGEDLPSDWPLDGTVGYDFLNLVNGVFIQTGNRKAFTSLFHRLIGNPVDFDTLVYQSKKLIMETALSSEVIVLTHMLDEISSSDRRARDFTRKALHDAIAETIACFPVYRTYIDERGTIIERDQNYIQLAIARAKRRNGNMPASVFDFLRDILLLRGADGDVAIYGYRQQLYFTLKFQQLTGPVMAKGMEDTACYVYNRFVSVNEVGGSPNEFGLELDEFHRGNLKRIESWPHSMLTTTTHDTKRSEDVRMRLDVLSEMPRIWAAQVMRWRRVNRTRKKQISDGRVVPDSNEEYLLYQTLIGTWPIQIENGFPTANLDPVSRANYIHRIQEYMTKAVHEAKVNLSWINPDSEYVEALCRFIDRILNPGTDFRPNTFLRLLETLVPRIAYYGSMNSLSQTLLKLTAPGVPDIYQGQELLDFSLVDPDNRRPVDFQSRQQILDELDAAEHDGNFFSQLMREWPDGRLKLWVTSRVLRFRAANREIFERGSYVPIFATGEYHRHLIGFARIYKQKIAIVAATRFLLTLTNGDPTTPVLGETWDDSELGLPADLHHRTLKDVLSGQRVEVTPKDTLRCHEVFRHLPLALLVSE